MREARAQQGTITPAAALAPAPTRATRSWWSWWRASRSRWAARTWTWAGGTAFGFWHGVNAGSSSCCNV